MYGRKESGKPQKFDFQMSKSHRMFRHRVKLRSEKVRSELCESDVFGAIPHFLNPEPDLRSGSAIPLNFEPNLGPVQAGSGLNCDSEPNFGITTTSQIIHMMFVDRE